MRAYAHNILYRFFDKKNNLLYVGITNNPVQRFNAHTNKDWFPAVASATMEHHKNRRELEHAEWLAIKNEKPKYNVLHSELPPALVMKRPSRRGTFRMSDANRFPKPDGIVNMTRDDMLAELLERAYVFKERTQQRRQGFMHDITMLHERLGVPDFMRAYRLRQAMDGYDADERAKEVEIHVG